MVWRVSSDSSICFSRMGLKRNLTTAEIVEQAVLARRLLTTDVGSITNVVFMVGGIIVTSGFLAVFLV